MNTSQASLGALAWARHSSGRLSRNDQLRLLMEAALFRLNARFAIAAFLLAYNGYSKREMVLSKLAAIAALGVAMFPCQCGDRTELVRHVMAPDALTGHRIRNAVPRLTFFGETAALIAFGISWLTASRTLPVLTRKDERFSPINGSGAKEPQQVTHTGAA